MAKQRIPLKESVSRNDVEQAAQSSNWLFWNVVQEDGQPYEIDYVLRDRKTSLKYVEDPVLDMAYVVVDGDEADDLAADARKRLDTYDVDDALAMIGDGESVHGVYVLAVAGLGTHSKKAFDALEKVAESDDEDDRAASIVACGYLGGDECRDLLKRLAADDESEQIRKDAALMLDGLEHS